MKTKLAGRAGITQIAAVALLSVIGACGGGGGILRISPGMPPVHPGAFRGYWIWHDDATGWHLRTTTAGQQHRFQGSVTPANGGQITQLTPTRVEWNDRIRVAGNGIEFTFETQGNEDGFDWRVSSGCNVFNLTVDGVVEPNNIHLGGANGHPSQMPFGRCR